MLNGQIGNTFTSIQLKRSGKSVRWANVQTRCTGAAVFADLRCIHGQWQIGVDFS
jgi:hypothetical protein